MRFPLIFAALCCAAVALADEPARAGKTRAKTAKHAAVPPSFTLYAASDIADCRKQPAPESMAARTADIVAAALARDRHAWAVTLGDNTYPVGREEEFEQCYQPTWGRFRERTLPAPGNHDYGMPRAIGYYNYFGELAGPGRRGYYARTLGSWRILSLNSNLDHAHMQEQMAWLAQELEQRASDKKIHCTLAYWHHPVFSSGGHGNNEVMLAAWKLLAQARADVVLSGHDHDYERFAPLNAEGERDEQTGIRSFVVGTGGAWLTPMFLPRPTTEIRDNATNGVLKLVLNERGYAWEFLPVAGQTFSDRGQGNCH